MNCFVNDRRFLWVVINILGVMSVKRLWKWLTWLFHFHKFCSVLSFCSVFLNFWSSCSIFCSSCSLFCSSCSILYPICSIFAQVAQLFCSNCSIFSQVAHFLDKLLKFLSFFQATYWSVISNFPTTSSKNPIQNSRKTPNPKIYGATNIQHMIPIISNQVSRYLFY